MSDSWADPLRDAFLRTLNWTVGNKLLDQEMMNSQPNSKSIHQFGCSNSALLLYWDGPHEWFRAFRGKDKILRGKDQIYNYRVGKCPVAWQFWGLKIHWHLMHWHQTFWHVSSSWTGLASENVNLALENVTCFQPSVFAFQRKGPFNSCTKHRWILTKELLNQFHMAKDALDMYFVKCNTAKSIWNRGMFKNSWRNNMGDLTFRDISSNKQKPNLLYSVTNMDTVVLSNLLVRFKL